MSKYNQLPAVIVAAPALVSANAETGVADPVMSAEKRLDPAAPYVGLFSMFPMRSVLAEIVANTTFIAREVMGI